MWKVGDQLLGIVSMKVDNKDDGLDASITNINLFPLSIFLEKHNDINHMEIRISLFNKLTFGMFVHL
tara:strand:- start:9786 stop:9986 length:201 start_codon:yes stop_codon:yes gene_type:complete